MAQKILFLICGIVVLVGVYVFFNETTVTNYPPKNTKIVAFGDSLIAGFGATSGNDAMTLLGTRLGRTVANFGVNGNTTTDGLLRVNEVLKSDPGVVILLLGGNDFLARTPREVTEKNLRSILDACIEKGSVVVLLGVRSGFFGGDSEELYEVLADEYGVIYVSDILDSIFHKPEYMYDRIHPNDKGYAVIAERLYEVFKEHDL